MFLLKWTGKKSIFVSHSCSSCSYVKIQVSPFKFYVTTESGPNFITGFLINQCASKNYFLIQVIWNESVLIIILPSDSIRIYVTLGVLAYFFMQTHFGTWKKISFQGVRYFSKTKVKILAHPAHATVTILNRHWPTQQFIAIMWETGRRFVMKGSQTQTRRWTVIRKLWAHTKRTNLLLQFTWKC